MLTNDIKKGAKLILTNGWRAEMMDNQKGNIRLANVHGLVTEMGSIYVWNIASVEVDGKYVPIELTDKQRKAKKLISGFLNEK